MSSKQKTGSPVLLAPIGVRLGFIGVTHSQEFPKTSENMLQKVIVEDGSVKTVNLTEAEAYMVSHHESLIASKKRSYDFIKTSSVALSSNSTVVEQLESIWDSEIQVEDFADVYTFEESARKLILELRLLSNGMLLRDLKRLSQSKYHLKKAEYDFKAFKDEMNIKEVEVK